MDTIKYYVGLNDGKAYRLLTEYPDEGCLVQREDGGFIIVRNFNCHFVRHENQDYVKSIFDKLDSNKLVKLCYSEN